MRPRLHLPTVLVAILGVAAGLAPSSAAASGTSDLPAERPGAGLVYDGLRPARAGGPCDAGHGGHFEIRSSGGGLLGCTHGPDPSPPGMPLASPTTTALAARTVGSAEAGSGVPCIGDGVSGFRVQAIYAFPADMASRYASVAPFIRGWAVQNVDDVFAASAAETGGSRRVRFVTEPNCQLDVDQVPVAATGDDTFSDTISQLRLRGYTRSDRKYLVWMDTPVGRASTYCGIGQLYFDESDAVGNYNNGNGAVPGMVSRIDAGCWGSTGTPVEAHELMHTLGGVQPAAPHSSARYPAPAGGHCTDEHDVMCYDDDGSGPASLTVACPAPQAERRFDCGHDDYFSTSPWPDSYLDTHWNTADSRFLDASAVGSTDSALGGGVLLTASRKLVPAGSRVRLAVTAPGCQTGDGVEMTGGGRIWIRDLEPGCTATVRTRVPRRTTFRAFGYELHGEAVAASEPVTVRVKHR
jgi:hypothetical protein